MERVYFSDKPETSNKKKVVLGALALVAIVGVVATVALYSSNSTNYALRQYEIDEQEFFGFIAKYNKVYDSIDEFNARFKIFRDNIAFARVHNTLGKTYWLGITQFSDLTHDEFKSRYTPNAYVPNEDGPVADYNPDMAAPSSVDWRTKGAVTAVKNQGQCGSCWSFSTTGAVEGTWFLAGHTLVSLSEQELMDCSTSYGNKGCDGGLMTSAFKFVVQKGLTTESNYPYKAENGECNTTLEKNVAAKISSYAIVAAKNSNALMAAVATKPVSVAVEADQAAWQSYVGGIVSSNCGTALDHGVLIVGYDNTNSPPYWIVKNSWGPSWGEQGYIRIAISKGDGVCGINMNPSYPIA
ncbi:unnamed protein product [Blepharisma stoltei]|uniref:Uncharacterized protein n=1 Tax=Blepharisma stoltei TaxID=1481888 RepID=A0AAU9IXG6_9CILI|nr:unnamed protein product [Blepharisma stoltei]